MLPASSYVLGLVAIVLGAGCTRVARAVARACGLVARPNPIVPQHTRPVAYLGGPGIALGAASALLVFVVLGRAGLVGLRDAPAHFAAIVVPGVLFLVLGAVDDRWRLSPAPKLALQACVAIVAVYLGAVHSWSSSPLVNAAASGLWILVLVNAYNFTDVCDGLLAGLVAVQLLFWSHLEPGYDLVAMALSGACIGFLFFNRPPASIFLGDSGSHFLGYAVAALTLVGGEASATRPYMARTLLVAGVPLFELVFITSARIRKGLPWWKGSPDHIALRLQAAGLGKLQTDVVLWGAALLGLGLVLGLGMPSRRLHIVLWIAAGIGLAASWRALWRIEVRAVAHAPEGAKRAPSLLWIHQNFVSARQAGNSRAIHFVSALLEAGWRINVVTTQAGYLGDGVSPGASSARELLVETEGGLAVHRLRSDARGFEKRARSYFEFAPRAWRCASGVERADVIFASSPPLPQILLSIGLSAWWRRPLVLEVRDLWPAFLADLRLLRSGAVLLALEWLEALAYRYADRVVAAAPAFAPYLQAMGVPGDRLDVVPTGGDPACTRTEPALGTAWRERQGLEGRFVVVYAGSFNEAYGLERVLDVAEALARQRPDVTWVFAGDGRQRSLVESRAEKLECVRYLGCLPKDELLPILAAADAGLVTLAPRPILGTVLPGKLFDYLATGIPVVCIAAGQPALVVSRARAGVTLGPTVAGIVAGMQAFVDLPAEERRDMGRRGREWVLAHCASASLARELTSVAERARSVPRGRPGVSRLIAAACGACGDVLARRSAGAVRRLYGENAPETIRASFEIWLERQARLGSQASPVHAAPMPRILSDRDSLVTRAP
jgi:UDP-N-acetylmuramyl pentapeptide phosphotransferase/UDP-N-acetylglucosamine-1-phosphate transferase/glycosyltransferase involved in cell wall biosynthesis